MQDSYGIWRNPRPVLTIVHESGRKISNCYYGSVYRITSVRPLSMEDIFKIRGTGFIGGGQHFSVLGQVVPGEKKMLVPVPAKLDWQSDVSESGSDLVEAIMIDAVTGNVIPDVVPTNQYTKEPLKPLEMSYYVYLTEDRVDSGD